jgi:hypothetical protein
MKSRTNIALEHTIDVFAITAFAAGTIVCIYTIGKYIYEDLKRK